MKRNVEAAVTKCAPAILHNNETTPQKGNK